jgi:uncharacterized protein (TIGR00369 family)
MKVRPFDKDSVLPQLDQGFRTMVPHNAALGLSIVDCAPGSAVMVLPWADHLVGDPDRDALHGGPITSLLDACGGAAVFLAMGVPVPIATLDLRIDYLRAGTSRREVRARCECYKLGRNVAFVRGVAYHDAPDDPIASCAATYMLSTKGRAVVPRERA